MSVNEIVTDKFSFVVEKILQFSSPIISSLVAILVGLVLSLILKAAIRPWERKLTPQALLVIRKAVSYSITAIVLITVLQQFGFKLTALLGAAGIAGIAIGFAAQTSLSNIISGLFLIWEKPFKVGDVIIIAGNKGVVESIDLLSLTLRTLDNLSVRLPNETLVKSELINVTKHPVRRFDILLGVAYKSDPDHVLRILREVANSNAFVLDEPKPLVCFTGFGESQLDFKFGVWHEKEDWIPMRNSILTDLNNTLKREGIEIPFPHRVIVTPEVDETVSLSHEEAKA